MELLKVLRTTENEDLTGVLQKLVCSYIPEITPLAIDITNQLVSRTSPHHMIIHDALQHLFVMTI